MIKPLIRDEFELAPDGASGAALGSGIPRGR